MEYFISSLELFVEVIGLFFIGSLVIDIVIKWFYYWFECENYNGFYDKMSWN